MSARPERTAELRYTPGPIGYNIAWILLTFLGVFGIHRERGQPHARRQVSA